MSIRPVVGAPWDVVRMTPNSSAEAAALPLDGPVRGPVREALPEPAAERVPGSLSARPVARVDAPELLGRRFAELARERDLDGLVGLYAADAVVGLPDGREAAGTEAIRAAFAAALRRGVDLRIESVGRPIVTESLACTYSTDAAGRVHTQVARREADGTWRWIRDGSRLRGQGGPDLDLLG